MSRTIAILGALSLLLSTRADAQSLRGEAARHWDEGVERSGERDFAGAVRAFEAAYAVQPLPRILFAWAQSARLGGDCMGALALKTSPHLGCGRCRASIALLK